MSVLHSSHLALGADQKKSDAAESENRTSHCGNVPSSAWGLGSNSALPVCKVLQTEAVAGLPDEKRNVCQMPAAEGRQLYDLRTKDCSSQTKMKQRYGLKLEKQTCEAGETAWFRAQNVVFESYLTVISNWIGWAQQGVCRR